VSGQLVAQVVAGVAFTAAAAAVARWAGLALSAAMGRAAARALVQLSAVGACVAAVFAVPPLAAAFVLVMLGAAAITCGGRLAPLPGARRAAVVAIGVPALTATAFAVAIGAFPVTARSIVPTAGILTGGAMAAATIAGRRLLECLSDDADEIETRLCLGDPARDALRPFARRAVTSGLIPVLDQTRSAGLVTLPGTFVGLVLGGASPTRAAATQLVVLLALLLVECCSALLIAEAIVRRSIAPGERVRRPGDAG
jgi:putative ABC transport system permease protein